MLASHSAMPSDDDAPLCDTYRPRPALQDYSVADRMDDVDDSGRDSVDKSLYNSHSPSDKGCSTYSNSSRTTSSEDSPT